MELGQVVVPNLQNACFNQIQEISDLYLFLPYSTNCTSTNIPYYQYTLVYPWSYKQTLVYNIPMEL